MLDPIEYYIEKRGRFCEQCGIPYDKYNKPERHHCLIHRNKQFPQLDNEINIELVCHRCHVIGLVNSYAHRREFALRQIERGYDVKSWVMSLPLKYIEDWLLKL